jgi:hypothetical protein
MKYAKAEVEQARDTLRAMLKPGDTVYTILRHVSRSGMMRHIAVVVKREDGIQDTSFLVATALQQPIDRDNGGVKCGGCGMDMGFGLVYNLSRTLFPDGFGCVGEHCPSNDHSNGDREYTLHENNGVTHWHSDGGYALKQRWL